MSDNAGLPPEANMRFLLTACLLLVTAAAAACDDDNGDDADSLRSEVEGAREELSGDINQALADSAGQLDEPADDVESGDGEAASNVNDRCDDFAGTVPSVLQPRVGEICADVEEAVDNQDG